jgi:hypothetical protein
MVQAKMMRLCAHWFNTMAILTFKLQSCLIMSRFRLFSRRRSMCHTRNFQTVSYTYPYIHHTVGTVALWLGSNSDHHNMTTSAQRPHRRVRMANARPTIPLSVRRFYYIINLYPTSFLESGVYMTAWQPELFLTSYSESHAAWTSSQINDHTPSPRT